MSASTERKLRKAAIEAGTDKKTLAAKEEAKKKAKSKRNWTIGTILIVLLLVFTLLMNSNLLYTATTAVQVGDRSFSPAELTYNYATQYYNWTSSYGSYASMFGLDTSYGLNGLDSQECTMAEDGTWKDYFMEQAESTLQQIVALAGYADENGIELTEADEAEIQADVDELETSAKEYGYANASKFLSANYGKGVTTKTAVKMDGLNRLASNAYNALSESFEFTDEELEARYADNADDYDTFSYIYYAVAADKIVTDGEDGESTEEVTEETMAEAKAKADSVAEAFKAAEGDDYAARLDAAIAEAGLEGSGNTNTDTSGSYVSSNYSDWIKDSSRKAGDIEVIENTSANGYNVVVFTDRGDNNYNTVQVRHILIKAEADENGEFTDEAKATAKAKAEDILAQWKAGEATEESFAALAEEYSEDAGSNTNGGLYDSIQRGQTVEEFNNFCFNENHKAGDTGIVYGDNGSYAGYHIMYFVGEGENCRKALARADLESEAIEAWLEENSELQTVIEKFFFKFAGKV